MRFLRLPIWRKRPTDEQYVARIRKTLRYAKWLRFLNAFIGCATVGLVIWGITIIVNIMRMPGPPGKQQNIAYSLFAVAIITGLTLGLWLANAAVHIGTTLFERRKDRMLVDLWDATHPKEDDSDDV